MGHVRRRYARELESRKDAWKPIASAARRGRVTLVYSSHDLYDYLQGLGNPQATNIPGYNYDCCGTNYTGSLDRARIAFDEGHVGGPAAERLDADRAGAGEAIEDASARQPWRQDIEQRLTQLVRRRAQAVPARCSQASPFIATGNDSHGSTTTARRSTTTTRTIISGYPSCSS